MTSRYSHDETVVLNIHNTKDDVEPTPVPGRKWRSVVAAAGIAASAGALSVAYMMSNEAPHMHVETQSLEQKLDIEPTVSATLTGASFETLDADSNDLIDPNELSGYLGPIYGNRIKEVLSSDLDEDIKRIKTELIKSVYTRQLDCWTAELASEGDVTCKTYPDFQDAVENNCPAAAFEPSTLDYELPQVDAVEEAPMLTTAMDVEDDAPEAAALDGAPPAPAVDDLLNPTASDVISFDDLDTNKDKILDDRELSSYLDDYFQSILSQVQMDASLSEDMKTLKTNLIKQQYETQSHCLEATINRFNEQDAIISPETFPLFEVMMGELCPPGVFNKDLEMDHTISQEGAQDEQSTIKEDVPPPTEEEVVEAILGATPQMTDHFDIAQQESNEAQKTTEEDNTPVNDPEVVAEEQKADEVEQSAEAGNDAAVEEVEQHEDAVEDAAESGDTAAVAEEEHHEAQVEQAAEEGNEAAIKEEEHFQEQVEEATADAPPAVKEEEQAVDETEQAAESGDQTAVEEVEQKQDELVEEAEQGNPEAAQVEEHLEVVEEQAATEGNPAAEEIVEHHDAEVAVSDESGATEAGWTPSEPSYPPVDEVVTDAGWSPLEPSYPPSDDVVTDAAWPPLEPTYPPSSEYSSSDSEVVENHSNELKEELNDAFGVGSDAGPAYQTIVDTEEVVPSPPTDIGATSTLPEELKEELTKAVDTGAADNTPTGTYDNLPTVDSQDLNNMANNLVEQIYTTNGDSQVGDWNWLNPSTATYGQVKDADQDMVNAGNVFKHLMEQHNQKTTELMSELLRESITFNMTLTCFSVGLGNIQKDHLTKDEYFQVVQWMNEKCQGDVAGQPTPDSKQYMTKGEFKARIAMQFEPTLSSYYASVLGIKAEYTKAIAMRQSIDECLDKATENSADPESGLVHASQFNPAMMWILDVCVGN